MIVFIVGSLLLTLFFAILSILAVKDRSPYLFGINILGLITTLLALVLEISDSQSRQSLMILLSLLIMVWLLDFAHVFNHLIHANHDKLDNPKLWRRVMANRNYKMITVEETFHTELEQHNEVGLTEKLQAFQMWKLGNRAFLQGDYQDALEKYNLSNRWLVTSVAWVNQCGIYFEKEEYDQVVHCCDEAIKANPDREEAWLNRGLAFVAKKDHNKALKSFDEALVVNAQNPEILTLQGNALRHLGRSEQSLEKYNQAIQLAANYLEAWFQRGILLSVIARFEEAIECFQRSLALNPKFAAGYYQLANVLNKLDRNEEAIAAYKSAIKIDPSFHEAWNNLGIAQSKMGQLKKSIKSYRRAIKIRPDYQEAWLNLALASESLNRYKDAIAGYQRFLELAPDAFARHRVIAKKHIDDLEAQLKPSPKSRKKEQDKSAQPATAKMPVSEKSSNGGTNDGVGKTASDPTEEKLA